MAAAAAALTPLRALGRQARWALPAGVFVGIALPDLAAALRPLLTAAVIGTLSAALLRLDWGGMAAQIRRPSLLVGLVAWMLVASPLLAWGAAALAGLRPELRLVLVLQAAAPPIGSSAVFAMILGLDGVVAMLGTIVPTLLLPFTLTPLVAGVLAGTGVEVDLLAFFLRVSTVVAAPFVIAWLLRRWIGAEALARNDELLAGCNVLLLLLFAIAVMDGVTERMLDDPRFIGLLLFAACAAALVLHAAGYWMFRRSGALTACNAALLSGNRNVGLMLAITAGTAGEAFSLYVGLAQIPMYFAPLLLTPLVRRSMRSG